MAKDFNITELLEELKDDPSWCEDKAIRQASVEQMFYFIIEN